MKKLTILVCFCSILLIAAIGDRFSITGLRIDGDGNWIGNVSMTGNKTLDGLQTDDISTVVIIDTATELTITDRYMLILSTGSNSTITSSADPFISTITYTQGTIVTIVVSTSALTGTLILGDNGTQSGSRLSLGSTTRSIKTRDNLTLRLRDDYWEEIGFTNNQ